MLSALDTSMQKEESGKLGSQATSFKSRLFPCLRCVTLVTGQLL